MIQIIKKSDKDELSDSIVFESDTAMKRFKV